MNNFEKLINLPPGPDEFVEILLGQFDWLKQAELLLYPMYAVVPSWNVPVANP